MRSDLLPTFRKELQLDVVSGMFAAPHPAITNLCCVTCVHRRVTFPAWQLDNGWLTERQVAASWTGWSIAPVFTFPRAKTLVRPCACGGWA